MIDWPRHISLSVEHNEHATYYQSAEVWAAEQDQRECPIRWASDEERAKAIAEDSIWTLHFYPDTPVGSYWVAASTFEAALAAAQDCLK